MVNNLVKYQAPLWHRVVTAQLLHHPVAALVTHAGCIAAGLGKAFSGVCLCAL